MWRNGPEGYGLVSRALHWGMAALIAVLLSLSLPSPEGAPIALMSWIAT